MLTDGTRFALAAGLRWAKALHTGPVLSEELRSRMVDGREARELGPGMRYGLGCELWLTEHGTAGATRASSRAT